MSVVNKNFCNDPADSCLHLIHHFHRFDDAKNCIFFHAIKKDHWYVFVREGFEMVQVSRFERKGSDQSVYPFVKKVLGICSFFVSTFVGVRNNNVVTRFGSDFFDAREYGCNKVTVQFMHQYADGMRLLDPEITCKMV